MVVILVAAMVFFSIFFLILNKKHPAVSNPTLSERLTTEDQETQRELLSGDANVLGSKSPGQIVFYDNDGVVVGTSLNKNLKPQIDITVDEKTVSKDMPPFVNTAKTLRDVNAFFVNGWMKFIELVSIIFDKIIS